MMTSKAIRIALLLSLSCTSGCNAFSTRAGTSSRATAFRPETFTARTRTSTTTSSSTLFLTPTRNSKTSKLLASDARHLPPAPKQERKAWPRRVISRIFKRDSGSASTDRNAPQLQMQTTMTMDAETEELLDSISKYYPKKNEADFILRNFEELTPDMILPQVQGEYFPTTAGATAAAASAMNVGTSITTNAPPSTISMAKLAASKLENVLSGIIHRQSMEQPENLSIQALPSGNVMASLLLRGRIETDCKIDASRLVFRPIRMSGGSLQIQRLQLNVLAFLKQPEQQSSSSVSRFPQQFDLLFDEVTFTRHDLLFSPCIRNGLQQLLVRILRDRGVRTSTIKVSSLDILSSGKISVKGEAQTLLGSGRFSFEVRSGISFSSRGHVLTFPGLEVSLHRDIGLFVPVVPEIDLDVGHNARFHSIDIDGTRKLLRLSAGVTITPESTIRLNDYEQSSKAFSARFSVDVGQWLTRIGNFSK